VKREHNSLPFSLIIYIL